MDYLAILQAAVQYGPMIKSIIDEASSNDTIVTKIKALSAPFASVLANVGAQFFPKAAPALQVAAAAMASFDTNVTKWVQGALNVYLSPSPNLVVDGVYGPKTKAAVELLQAKLGLTVDGWAGQVTQAAIAQLLVKK